MEILGFWLRGLGTLHSFRREIHRFRVLQWYGMEISEAPAWPHEPLLCTCRSIAQVVSLNRLQKLPLPLAGPRKSGRLGPWWWSTRCAKSAPNARRPAEPKEKGRKAERMNSHSLASPLFPGDGTSLRGLTSGPNLSANWGPCSCSLLLEQKEEKETIHLPQSYSPGTARPSGV